MRNREVIVGDCIQILRRKHKIKKSEYLPSGTVPVVDQSNQFIAGYINQRERSYDGELPVLVFGDHTCVLKYVDFPFAIGADGTQLIRPKKDFDIRYFYYTLRNLPLEQFGYQRHFKYLKTSIVSCPPMYIQRKIATVLGSYDDLIENNTRRIEILEEMAGTIYREWCVEFRFPGHEKVKMVESELGLIPQGWEIKRLSDIVSEIIDYRGKTPRKLGGRWSESGIMALSAMNIKQGRLVRLEKAKFVSEELYKRWMKSEVAESDILMTSEAPLGEVYYLTEKKKICLSQRLYCIRANPNFIKPCVLFYALGSPASKAQLHARATGTTVSGIRQAALREILFVIPPQDLQNRAEMVLETLLKIQETLVRTNTNLRKTRDLLLPKLISGELDVSELNIDTTQSSTEDSDFADNKNAQ